VVPCFGEPAPISALAQEVVAVPGMGPAHSEEISVVNELKGILKRVAVEEGDDLKGGQLIAEFPR